MEISKNDDVLKAQLKMKKIFVEKIGIPQKAIKVTTEEKLINEKTGEVTKYRREW